MDFAGQLETHITVRVSAAEKMAELQGWAVSRGLKYLRIVLDRGAVIEQPMLTRRENGTLSEALATASDLSRTLSALGFEVIRIKIEASPHNKGVPLTDRDARTHPGDRYFEHHIKLLLPPNTDTRPLAEIAQQHAAHLSRNALKVREDGYEERFVTQRCGQVGRTEARRAAAALVNALRPLGFPFLDMEEEFVVYDSHQALDAGWIG